ncbi:MarR family winged helix-turn-helix transcriptional regulator [Gordonia rhizosphera]|uniref:Putative MarR family transcriptional regulator n=1 Tax=Gordonia rhizosphera NBRC 16068 TaxID=1108045 RepID=K6WLV6_9ACTN|nr:MarR family transcriptional regulator [Gordonia rhizosphera]GAB93137.1 putative MarR family transcriptional regulator [Gordonia rhizosphera NBRC 16068]
MAVSRQEAIGAVGRALQGYQRTVQSFDDAVARRLGVGPADLRCLDWLSEAPRTAGELSVATGLRPAATTALIDRLTDKGFVRRIASPTDRRRVLVELTDEGRQRIWECYGPMVNEGQHLFDGYSAAQLAMLGALLDEMSALTERHREHIENQT